DWFGSALVSLSDWAGGRSRRSVSAKYHKHSHGTWYDGEPGSVESRSRLGHGSSRIHLRGNRKRARALDQTRPAVVYLAVGVSLFGRSIPLAVPEIGPGVLSLES